MLPVTHQLLVKRSRNSVELLHLILSYGISLFFPKTERRALKWVDIRGPLKVSLFLQARSKMVGSCDCAKQALDFRLEDGPWIPSNVFLFVLSILIHGMYLLVLERTSGRLVITSCLSIKLVTVANDCLNIDTKEKLFLDLGSMHIEATQKFLSLNTFLQKLYHKNIHQGVAINDACWFL